MLWGITILKCDECGNRFVSPKAEWCCTCLIAPMPCPKCRSMHTYPAGLSQFGGIFGPRSSYRQLWEHLDKERQGKADNPNGVGTKLS